MTTTRLRVIYDDLRTRAIDPAEHDGELGEAAFEITTADTFIAGVAATLLEGKQPDASHRSVLTREYLLGSCWLLSDGRRIDLRHVPEMYAHARLVEQLRKECLRCSGN
jgi:hypothetical protein